MNSSIWSVVLVGSLAIGCQGSPSTASSTLFADSAGVKIAINDLIDAASWPVCSVPEPPSLRIGALDGAPVDQLYQVEDALRLDDGRIIILNGGTQELRIFDSSGTHLTTIGGDGEGPGEFRDPIEIALYPPDSVAVWDRELGRISLFSADGHFGRAINLQPPPSNPTGHMGVFASGPTVVVAAHEVKLPDGAGFLPQRLLLLRYQADGVLLDTARVLPYGRLGIINSEARMAGGPLFDARGVFAVAGDLLYSSDGLEPSLEIRNATLHLVRLIRWSPPTRAVTAADIERYKRERLEGLTGSMLTLMRQRYEAVPASDSFPAVSDLLPGPDGSVWVRTYQKSATMQQSWWLFDQRGVFQCVLRLPPSAKVLQFEDAGILAVTPDNLGTEYLSVFRLELPPR